MVDDGAHAGVGGAHDGALELQGAHAGDGGVLVQRHGVVKPAQVAQVHQHRWGQIGLHEAGGKLFAEQVFVANMRPQALALRDEGGRRQRAPVEVAQRDVHQRDKPMEHRWNEFTEGHQVVFVITVVVRLCDAQTQRGVGVATLRITPGYADQRTLVFGPQAGLQALHVAGRPLGGQQGDGGLGQDHQRALRSSNLAGIPTQRLLHRGCVKLVTLADIALQQGDAQRAGGLRPIRHGCREWQAQNEQGGGCPAQQQALGQYGGQPGAQRRQPVGPDPGRIKSQRTVDMGVTHRAPTKAGQPGAARHFGCGPQGCKKQAAGAPWCRATVKADKASAPGAAPIDQGRQRVIHRQRGGQEQGGEDGQQRVHSAVHVHGDHQPPEGRGQPTAGKNPARKPGLAPAD